MGSSPQVKTVVPNLSYSSSSWDDPLDTWDASDAWDGIVSVQSGFSDQVLVDVLVLVLILLPLFTSNLVLR